MFAPPRFPGWSLCFPPSCRAGVHARRTLAISKIGTLRRRRARRDEGIPPYGRPGGCGFRLAAGPPLVVGEGFIPPADTCGGAGSPGRCEHRPLQRFAISQKVRLPGWPRPCCFVGADSISARGCSRRRVFPDWASRPTRPGGWAVRFGRNLGRDLLGTPAAARGPRDEQASSPTEVCGLRRRAFKSWLARLFKNAPALAGATCGPARDHATHALKNSPPDCFLRLAPPGFQVLADPFI